MEPNILIIVLDNLEKSYLDSKQIILNLIKTRHLGDKRTFGNLRINSNNEMDIRFKKIFYFNEYYIINFNNKLII